jgi:SAM-dependent methyltransferase
MKIYRLRSYDDYKTHVVRNKPNYDLMQQYESKLSNHRKTEFTVKGISYPANQFVDFKVDYLYGDGKNINWRERLVCPITQLSNRLRSSIQVMDFELNVYPESVIYATEQVTPVFAFLQKKFPNIIGSEYLGDGLKSGDIKNGIRHEDMTNLSFDSESLEYYLSFECFEHIPYYKKAITEVYRTLKPGGVFLGTFPFNRNEYNNQIRATLDDQGNIVHLMEPEYHGDPVSENGILCYTVFGWQILDEFRQAGFSDVYAMLIWSDVFGYLGGEQVYFIAKK